MQYFSILGWTYFTLCGYFPANGIASFFHYAELNSIVFTHHIFLICAPADGFLGLKNNLVVVNSTVGGMAVCASVMC